jgi:hypothetical protein
MKTVGIRAFGLALGVWGVVSAAPAAASTVYRVQLQTTCNTYLTGETSGLLSANRTAGSSTSIFNLEDLNGGALLNNDPVTLQTPGGRYVWAGTDGLLRVTGTAYGSSSVFNILRSSGSGTVVGTDLFSLRVSTGGYVTVPTCPSSWVGLTAAIDYQRSRFKFALSQLFRAQGYARAVAKMTPGIAGCSAAPMPWAELGCTQSACSTAQAKARQFLSLTVPATCAPYVTVDPCTFHGC